MELNGFNSLAKSFLEAVFLVLAFFGFFFFVGLLDFFHEVATPVTVQPGLVAVYAEVGGDIILVELKTGVHKQVGVVSGKNRNN